MKFTRVVKSGETVPAAVISRRFGYLVLIKARLHPKNPGMVEAFYGVPKP